MRMEIRVAYLFLFFCAVALLGNPLTAFAKTPVQIPVQAPNKATEKPLIVLAFGDSLTAGYGLKAGEDYPSQLQKMLEKDLKRPVIVRNAGVSGDTSAGGLARIDWSLSEDPKPDLVLLALGANDMLRGLPAQQTKDNLTKIIEKIQAQKIDIVLVGMKASINLGPDYAQDFDRLYKDLAKTYKLPLIPFMLEGVALDPKLNLTDGIHPNQLGTKKIAETIKPAAIKILKQKK
jgi:acyl-CoA thioesterase I